MISGLNPSEIEFIKNTVLNPLAAKGARVFLFGSRARGDHSQFSDVDLLIVPTTDSIQSWDFYISQLSEKCEESSFPYKVDFVLDLNLAKSYREKVMIEKVELT